MSYFQNRKSVRFLIGVILILLLGINVSGNDPVEEESSDEFKEKRIRKPVELAELLPLDFEKLNELPKNLAKWHMGASLLIPQSNGSMNQIPLNSNLDDFPEAVILGDDESIGYELPEGKTTIIVDLGDNYQINRFILIGYGATGKMHMATATTLHDPESRKWMTIIRRQKIVGRDRMNMRFPHTEARYVKLDFDITTKGDVGGLGIMGIMTVAQTQFRDPDEELSQEEQKVLKEIAGKGNINFDYASLYSGSSVSHITSGKSESISQMIDDDFTTYHDFDTEDEETVLVVDISETFELDAVSVVFDATSGSMNFHLFNTLPNEMNYIDADEVTSKSLARTTKIASLAHAVTAPLAMRGGSTGFQHVRLPEGFFEEIKPLYSQSVDTSDEKIRFEFDRQDGRFLFVRYLPVEKDSKPLRVYEISILASIPKTRALLDKIAQLDFTELGPSAPAGIPDFSTDIPPLSE